MASTTEAVAARGKSRVRIATRSSPAPWLIAATSALLILGLIMILSASSVSSFANYGSSFLFFKKQLLWAMVGIASFLGFAHLDYRKLRGFSYLIILGVAALLVAVLIPGIGVISGGSSRWVGAGPFTFQPSEFAKLALVLFAADVLSRKKEKTLDDPAHAMLPIVPVMGVLGLLVLLQPDLGTALILGIIGLGILFIGGARIRHLIPLTAVGAAIATGAALAEPYRRARLLSFFNPWADPLNTGYQTIQSLIALGSGGWFGVGLGASRQKWSYIPNAHTDFIFAILGEEMGLLGTIVVVGMFCFLAYLGVRTARRAPDRFGMLVAAGVTMWISFQALINIGAVTASLPITGVPLPLVSFGGSSLVVTLTAVGILVNIARQGRSRPARRRS
jgi:cell division protein FtsW